MATKRGKRRRRDKGSGRSGQRQEQGLSPELAGSSSLAPTPRHASQDEPTPEGISPWRARLPYLVLLGLALAVRLALALVDTEILHHDEIYQSVEQAHRVVFGHGLLSWEFRDGARSWVFPGAIAGLYKLGALLGLESAWSLLVLLRLALIGLGLAGVWASMRLAGRLAGDRAVLLCGALCALFPLWVALSHRFLSETVSGPLLVICALLVGEPGSRRRSLAAGALLALAVFVRYQNGIAALAIVVALAVARRWRDVGWVVAAGAGGALAGGLLDWLTWGRPFHSLLVYIQFNLVQRGSELFGTAPASYYLTTLATAIGLPLLLALAVGVVVGLREAGARRLLLIVGAYVLPHLLLPHKELRFLLPVMPLLLVAVAVGLARQLDRLGLDLLHHRLLAGGLAIAASVHLGALTLDDLDGGRYRRPPGTIWQGGSRVNELIRGAGERPDLCGIGLVAVSPLRVGGYSYLHRDAPMFLRVRRRDQLAALNYLITGPRFTKSLPPAFKQVLSVGDYKLHRRDGPCASAPADHREILPGAQNLGLKRRPR